MRSSSFCLAEILHWSWIKIILAFFLFFILPTSAFAAALSFSPAVGTYAPGAVFSVGINVNSGGESLNAASGVVSFPVESIHHVFVGAGTGFFKFTGHH